MAAGVAAGSTDPVGPARLRPPRSRRCRSAPEMLQAQLYATAAVRAARHYLGGGALAVATPPCSQDGYMPRPAGHDWVAITERGAEFARTHGGRSVRASLAARRPMVPVPRAWMHARHGLLAHGGGMRERGGSELVRKPDLAVMVRAPVLATGMRQLRGRAS